MAAECVLGILGGCGNENPSKMMSLCYLPKRSFLSPTGSLHRTSLLKDLFDTFNGHGAGDRSCTEISDAGGTSV